MPGSTCLKQHLQHLLHVPDFHQTGINSSTTAGESFFSSSISRSAASPAACCVSAAPLPPRVASTAAGSTGV